ncbi:MAG: holo-[acyl-carrier-protein] synthase [Candidatus Marinimicrobia bacterium]|nr:holo-[acyl-carrier-protein] synthase [Candidatus Neomarinimicrobiota bacterium]
MFVGTDIVSIDRIRESVEQYGSQFLNKIFTINEIEYSQGKKDGAIHLAGRFAAKESIKKAIFSSQILKQLDFIDIEIFNDVNGAPKVSILKELKFKKIEISISHESKYAVAFALLVV